MNRSGITRIVAMLTGAGTLFGLQQALGLQFYFALPAAVLAYLAMLVGVGLLLGADKPAK
jgi:hypothetical protein